MRLVSIFLFVIICVACQSPRSNETYSSLDSFRKAKAILDSSIIALGGLEKIRAIEQVTVEYNGSRYMINQSRKAERPWDKEPSVGKVHVDRKNDRIYTENASYYPGIGSYAGAVRFTGTKGFGIDYQKNYHGTEAWLLEGQASKDSQWSSCARWIPPLLAMQALENKTTMRFLGSKSIEGNSFSAVSFVQPNKAHLVLLFDEHTRLLAGYETIRDDGVYGDVTETVLYSGFKDINGLKMPEKRIEYFNDEVARELSFNVSLGVPMQDSDFLLPEGHTMPLASNEPYVRIRKIADGVYMDQDMGGILIIEFQDYCVALDCPGDFEASQSTIDAMHEILPSKPIRYVVTSHTHGDHGGGVRAYYHSGATVITTPGHENFYKEIADIRQTINPDPLFYSKKKPVIEVFNDKKVISDGSQVVELYNIGKNAHSDELTIAYLPKQKLLWQADQFFVPYTGSHLNAAMPVTVEFAKKLKELGLTDFGIIIDPHFNEVSTKADFVETLSKAGYKF